MKLDGSVGILGNGAGLVDVDRRRRRHRRREAGELLRPRRRRQRAGRGRRARGDHARRAGALDLLQHLRRHHPLRRSRARDPRGARADGDRDADRRSSRRHERRGGAQDPAGRGGRRTCTSSRRCSTRRAVRWSSRHDRRVELARRRLPRVADARVRADLDIVVEMCDPHAGKKILDVASGGGHVTRRLRERGAEVVSLDPSPGMRADVLCSRRAHPVRRRLVRLRRHADRAASLRARSARRSARWRASRTPRS